MVYRLVVEILVLMVTILKLINVDLRVLMLLIIAMRSVQCLKAKIRLLKRWLRRMWLRLNLKRKIRCSRYLLLLMVIRFKWSK